MKSAPFMHMCIVKTSKYTPKVTKKLTIHANKAKFANHFLFHTMVNGTPQNLQRIAQNPPNSLTLIQNCTKFVHFTLIFQSSVYPVAKLPKFVLSA